MTEVDLSDLLVDAMAHLGQGQYDFGRDNKGEDRFQEALDAALNNDFHLQCDREKSVPSARFPNEIVIIPDLLLRIGGRTVAIELKYVYCQPNSRKSNNDQGFPWDVIKDCAKIETLIEDRSGIDPTIDDGFVIGLTDVDFWSNLRRDWWSSDYVLPDAETWTPVGAPRLFQTLKTTRRKCIHPGITYNKRFHVALRHRWEYRWIDWIGEFRFILFRRSRLQEGWDGSKLSTLLNEPEFQLTTVPFADAAHREMAMGRAARFSAEYERNGRKCPSCFPGPNLGGVPFSE